VRLCVCMSRRLWVDRGLLYDFYIPCFPSLNPSMLATVVFERVCVVKVPRKDFFFRSKHCADIRLVDSGSRPLISFFSVCTRLLLHAVAESGPLSSKVLMAVIYQTCIIFRFSQFGWHLHNREFVPKCITKLVLSFAGLSTWPLCATRDL
jgi:hypothetical protein